MCISFTGSKRFLGVFLWSDHILTMDLAKGVASVGCTGSTNVQKPSASPYPQPGDTGRVWQGLEWELGTPFGCHSVTLGLILVNFTIRETQTGFSDARIPLGPVVTGEVLLTLLLI